MSAIGSLVFCTDCGNLLDGSAGKQNAILTCQVCGASCRGMLPDHSRATRELTSRRHLLQSGSDALEARCFPFLAAIEAVRSADYY
jgi:DNA-directed RNA polymerase subunit M/transcription elongation factor TFIIS